MHIQEALGALTVWAGRMVLGRENGLGQGEWLWAVRMSLGFLSSQGEI